MPSARCFPPPWIVEERPESFIIRDAYRAPSLVWIMNNVQQTGIKSLGEKRLVMEHANHGGLVQPHDIAASGNQLLKPTRGT
jgi:hypothetical protein